MSKENSSTLEAEKQEVEKAKSELDEQIETLEPVKKSVKRTLTHPDGSKKSFSQHELAFLPKIKFIRLLSGTLRLSASEEQGVGSFISDILSGLQSDNQQVLAQEFLSTILSFAELAPDFIEETIILALNVKPQDQAWVMEAVQKIDDDTGMDIIEVFVAQNGVALRDFFTKRLPRIGKRLNQELKLEELEVEEVTA